MRYHRRLLENLLLHEVAVITLFHRCSRSAGRLNLTLDRISALIMDNHAATLDDDPVTLLKVRNLLGQRSQSQGIRSEVHFARSIPHDKRRTATRADDLVRMRAENDCQRKSTAQPRQDFSNRFFRRRTTFNFERYEMSDNFTVGVAFKRTALVAQFRAKILVILDNSVVNQRHMLGRVRVSIALGGRTMSCPAGVGDADLAGSRITGQLFDEIVELPLSTAADQVSIVDRANPGAVIAAVFHAPEAVDQSIDNRAVAHDTDNSAHIL